MARQPRPLQRSYSSSHAHGPSWSVMHTTPSLGQGAQVVRTPADAMSYMAQPGTLNSSWAQRKNSLRDHSRRPSVTTEDRRSPPPTLPEVETSSLEILKDDLGDIHTRLNKNPSLQHVVSPRSPPRASPAPPRPLDIDAEYQRRLASRTSNATITPARPRQYTNPLSPGWSGRADQVQSVSPSDTVRDKRWRSPPIERPGLPEEVPVDAVTPPKTISPPPASTPRPMLVRSATVPSKHAANASTATAAPATTSPQPFAPVLISHTDRAAVGNSSLVLVTLRFAFSLEADPNTHEVTVTLDTLRPAGGRLVAFIEQELRPASIQSDGTLGMEGLEMTDGSSAEDSDFEFDDTRLHPMLQDEYLVALALASSPGPKPDMSSNSSSPVLTRQPSTARFRGPPSAFHHPSSYGTALPSLSALPAALAQARAEREATAAASRINTTQPLAIRRPRSNTCPGPVKGTLTELTVLLQRDAAAWHVIASRLCSGSWPEMAGRRRRVEDECRWAGMEPLLSELDKIPCLQRRGGFV